VTIQQFIADIQACYRTKYNEVQAKYIVSWLSKNQPYLSLIIAETLKSFDPTSTKPIPAVYDYEQALKRVKTQRMRPELKTPDRLQITDGEYLSREESAERWSQILKPLVEKKNVRRNEK